MEQTLLQTFTLAIFAGILIQVLTEKFKMPGIVFLIITGVCLGPQCLGWIHPEALGDGLGVLTSLGVALILFEGGLCLDLNSLKTVNKSVYNMTIFGTLIHIFGGAVLAHYIVGLSWELSILYGSFISIAGITAINLILDRVKVKKEVTTIMRSEGIFSDAIGAFLSVGILQFILAAKDASIVDLVYDFSERLLIGVFIGFLMGWILGRILKHRFVNLELINLSVLAWVFLTYFLSNMMVSNTGIMAVAVAGFAVQREKIPQLATLKHFKGQLTVLFIAVLFILIAADLDLAVLSRVGAWGVLVSLLIVFLVRPLAVFTSNHGLLNFKDKIFISWIGPKGIVAASVASLFKIILEKNGIDQGMILESLVFVTIMVTEALPGLSARSMARWCDCLVEKNNIIIVGANSLGRTLAIAFKAIGKTVVMIDNNIDRCKIAQEGGLEVIHGNCLDPQILEAANAEGSSVLIATTANAEVNYLACKLAKELYKIPELYPAIDLPHKGMQHDLVDEIGGNLAYAKPVVIEDWKEAIDANDVMIVDIVLTGKGGILSSIELPGLDSIDWIPLILKSKDKYFFAHADQIWHQSDLLIYLVKSPKLIENKTT
jgi:NhaP-type Na+/H+ or K+/H+ antiporter